jgi:peptide/nickel transport system substrate-binding protein
LTKLGYRLELLAGRELILILETIMAEILKRIWQRRPAVACLLFALNLVSCSGKGEVTPTATQDADLAEPTPTRRTEVTIVAREQLIIGVDPAFPPFVDLNGEGELVGLEVDLANAVLETAGLVHEFASTDWDSIFLDLSAGRFDAVLGGVTEAVAPAELVELSGPYLEIGEVAVVLEGREELQQVSDLANAVVGVEALSWGEFAVQGDDAFFPLPAGNVRRFEGPLELVQALFDGYVDAIITHHTVIESYVNVNPGYLRILEARPEANCGEDPQSCWLTAHRFHIAVPKGADELLGVLDAAIRQLRTDGRAAEILQAWGYVPVFAERPHFVQDSAATSLIAGIEKVDDLTVRFVLNRPDPNFDYKMAVPAMTLHSPRNLGEYGGGPELGLHPVGTGPYRTETWEPGEPIMLTANVDYWGKRPLIETIVITGVAQAAERYEMLKAGEAALIENLGADDLEALEEEEDKELTAYSRVPVNVAYLGMNRDLAPFDDGDMRLAVAICVDQAELIETVYPTGTLIANQFVPPNTFGFTAGLLWYDQDTERSAELVTAAGYPGGLTVTLSLVDVPSDYLPEPLRIAEVISDQLSACNITTTLQVLEPDRFADQLAAGELPLHLGGWSADFPGPIGLLNAHFSGAGNGEQFGAPFPTIVDLLDEAAQTSDRALRADLYGKVNQLLKEKAIFVPLAHGSSTLVAHSDLPGVQTNPVRRESLATVGPLTDTLPYTTFVYALGSLPLSLDPTDEVDDATFAVTNQVFETLVDFEPATTVLTTGLAIEWHANDTFDVWEFSLRPGVRFHDGTELDADAVILNFERLWDATHPLHVGRTGAFRYFQILFGGFVRPR